MQENTSEKIESKLRRYPEVSRTTNVAKGKFSFIFLDSDVKSPNWLLRGLSTVLSATHARALNIFVPLKCVCLVKLGFRVETCP